MTKFNFKLKGKRFSIDVEECKNIFSKMSGLMFRKKSIPLLFIFEKPVDEPIHSFFCVPFICLWFNNGKIIQAQYVKPWRLYVKPSGKFDKMLEIPLNDKNFFKILELIKK